jgi:hypothetical protein
MAAPNLGRLQRVPLREVWKSESGDFTPWLAREENLRLLGETIGLDLELESRERDVGPFRADLLCKNTVDDSWVLIENQIERTDHTHLGQILTYAAGLEAVTVAWVAEHFTDEHRAALDWLNEITLDKFTFFGLEVELWRIGDSPAAPKFNVVSKPNDWVKEVSSSARSGELSDRKQLQLRYWTAFRAFLETRSSIPCQKPGPHHWMSHAIGRSGAHISSIASFWTADGKVSENRVELVIDGTAAKAWFAELERAKVEIEKELGFPVIWYDPQDAKVCTISVRTPADIRDDAHWPEQFEWLHHHLELFTRVFTPRVKAL